MSTPTVGRGTSVYDGFVWVHRNLQAGEALTIKWRGIRKTWLDATVMPWLDEASNPDRDVTELCELFLAWKTALYDDNDPQLAMVKEGHYRRKLAEMIADCAAIRRMELLNVGASECSR